MSTTDKTLRINFNCPGDLATLFQRETDQEACSMSQVLLRLVTDYVQARVSVREATTLARLPDWALVGMEASAAADEPASVTPTLEAGIRPGELGVVKLHEEPLPSRLL